MLQIQTIRENASFVIERLHVKNVDATESINTILALDADIRALKKALDTNLMEQNKLSKEIGILFKSGKAAEAAAVLSADGAASASENQGDGIVHGV